MGTVLVVDDEFGIAEVLEAVLTDSGHTVRIAINGKQGLQLLAEGKPDLVLSDFMMPVLDGPGMLRAMAADPRYRSIPVILMSSLSEAAVVARCGGYIGFLRKPFTLQAVTDAVGRALGEDQGRAMAAQPSPAAQSATTSPASGRGDT